jgi:hypothetical protein
VANVRKGMSYAVTAVAPTGARKVIASAVGPTRAAKLALEIKARGFGVEVAEAGFKAISLTD